jgi:hypothetical protein
MRLSIQSFDLVWFVAYFWTAGHSKIDTANEKYILETSSGIFPN